MSGMLPSYTTQIAEEASFFSRWPYLEYDFMIANLFKLNLSVLKISKASQGLARGGVLC